MRGRDYARWICACRSRSERPVARSASSLHLCGERRDAAAARTGEAAMGPGSLALAVLPTIGAGAQPEEARTTPGGAGDGPRDRREAGVRSVAPQIAAPNNGDRVPLAPIFAP